MNRRATFAVSTDKFSVPELRASLLGQRGTIPRALAAAELRRRHDPQLVTILAGLLHDAHEQPDVRALAAAELSRVGTEDAVSVLSDAHPLGTGLVHDAVRRALGEVAPLSAGAILAIARPDGQQLPLPAERASAIEIQPADSQTRRSAAQVLGGPDQELADLDQALVMQCLTQRFLLLPASRSGDLLRTQATTIAWVAVPMRGSPGWQMLLQVVSRPSADVGGLELLGVNALGEVTLVGSASLIADGLDFELGAATRPGAVPLDLAGTYTGGVVRFERATSGSAATQLLLPQPGTGER